VRFIYVADGTRANPGEMRVGRINN